jgi:hypothetical protein
MRKTAEEEATSSRRVDGDSHVFRVGLSANLTHAGAENVAVPSLRLKLDSDVQQLPLPHKL